MNHRLEEIRKLHGLNQTEMGEILGLSLRGYQYVEKGERDLSLKHIETVADHFGIPPYCVLIDPKVILDEFDTELASRYKSAPDHIQKTIKDLLGMK